MEHTHAVQAGRRELPDVRALCLSLSNVGAVVEAGKKGVFRSRCKIGGAAGDSSTVLPGRDTEYQCQKH